MAVWLGVNSRRFRVQARVAKALCGCISMSNQERIFAAITVIIYTPIMVTKCEPWVQISLSSKLLLLEHCNLPNAIHLGQLSSCLDEALLADAAVGTWKLASRTETFQWLPHWALSRSTRAAGTFVL